MDVVLALRVQLSRTTSATLPVGTTSLAAMLSCSRIQVAELVAIKMPCLVTGADLVVVNAVLVEAAALVESPEAGRTGARIDLAAYRQVCRK